MGPQRTKTTDLNTLTLTVESNSDPILDLNLDPPSARRHWASSHRRGWTDLGAGGARALQGLGEHSPHTPATTRNEPPRPQTNFKPSPVPTNVTPPHFHLCTCHACPPQGGNGQERVTLSPTEKLVGFKLYTDHSTPQISFVIADLGVAQTVDAAAPVGLTMARDHPLEGVCEGGGGGGGVGACEHELKSSSWNGGKPVGGPESYGANPWRFDGNNRFVTERDGCNGRWHVRANASAPGGVVLRMDWEAGQAGNYAEFARQAAGSSPEWVGRGSSYGFMNSWNIKRRGATSGAAEEPQPGAAADPTGAAMILVNKGDSR